MSSGDPVAMRRSLARARVRPRGWLPFRADTHLPPGRTRVAFDEAERLLVCDPRFRGSATRAEVWSGFERYMAMFVALEQDYLELLAGRPLVHYLWLGGSFVSAKLDPRNIDVTVCVDDEARALLRGRRGAGWLTKAFGREHVLRHYKVSPLEMRYRAVPTVFQLGTLESRDRGYLEERGAWDDWWQRCRTPGAPSDEPTRESAIARRGYLEVTL